MAWVIPAEITGMVVGILAEKNMSRGRYPCGDTCHGGSRGYPFRNTCHWVGIPAEIHVTGVGIPAEIHVSG